MPEVKPLTVITVHGTGDTASDLDGTKWFQRGSVFTEKLRAKLAERGYEAEIVPHLWSGANSARARENGADKLADRLRRRGRGSPAHIVAHSHGGNVANEAAEHMRWGKRAGKERIASLTTVGTPFFKSATGVAERYAGLAFLGITILCAVMFVLLALMIAIVAATEGTSDLGLPLPLVLLFSAIVAISLYFMLRLSFAGYRRITRPSRRQEVDQQIHALYHPNDEAIAFLQKVEALPIQPFPAGSFFRQSRGGAIVWGVRAVLLLAVIGILLFWPGGVAQSTLKFLYGLTGEEFGAADNTYGSAAAIGFAAFAFMPAAFSIVYVLYRLLFGLIPDWLTRPAANNAIANALKGMAFGRDGDQRLSNVSTASHTFPTHEATLTGAIADRLQANAAKAAGSLIEKYRWSLFTVGSDTNAALSNLATDAMTWDSLIHTTYFDHDETIDLIADHIADRARAAEA
jgi:hypothetical protein